MVELLLVNGVDVNIFVNCGYFFLMWVWYINIVRVFFRNGVDWNVFLDKLYIVLIVVVFNGYYEIVCMFFEKGVFVSLIVLCYVMCEGYMEVV